MSTSNYKALQVYLNKRKGNVFFTAGYTYAKAFGDSSGQGDNPENFAQYPDAAETDLLIKRVGNAIRTSSVD